MLCLPWLNPFALGPSPNITPWLFSLACVAISLGVVSFSRFRFAQEIFEPIAWAWLVAGLISSVIGLLQYFGIASAFSPWVNQTNFGEAFANLRQRNQFATLSNVALLVVLWLSLKTHNTQSVAKSLYGGWVMVAASLLAVGNAISSSRTGLFQLILVCTMVGLWGGFRCVRVRRLLMCAVVVYASAMFAFPWAAGLDLATHGAFARMGNDQPCSSRLVLWSNVLHLIAQKPLLGWGWGELDFAHFITTYNEPRFCDILDNAHNLALHLAVELGVPVALLVCGVFAWWVVGQRPWAERNAARQVAWAVVAVILLHSMLEYPLWYGPFQIAFCWCVYFLWSGAKNAKNASKTVSNRRLAQFIRAQAAIVLIAFLGFAAWDYHRISQIYLQPEQRASAYRSDTLLKIRSSWLFADQVRFAELMLTPLTAANAAWVFDAAQSMLHYSPEPRVAEKAIESAVMLGRDDEAIIYLAAYRAAFPIEHARWAAVNLKSDVAPR